MYFTLHLCNKSRYEGKSGLSTFLRPAQRRLSQLKKESTESMSGILLMFKSASYSELVNE